MRGIVYHGKCGAKDKDCIVITRDGYFAAAGNSNQDSGLGTASRGMPKMRILRIYGQMCTIAGEKRVFSRGFRERM
jgi:hypothetical protein